MTRLARLRGAVAVAVATVLPITAPAALAAPPGGPEGEASSDTDRELVGSKRPYPGSPDDEAALVADEDYRLSEVRTVASLSRWSDAPLSNPYRLVTSSSYTLVLTARRDAYTLTDLLVLAPQTFVRQADGSYLLSEHLVVQAGATLSLAAPEKLVLRLASDAQGFVSIVSYGGRLEVLGTQGAPVEISSWDRDQGAVDTTTTDGRAYIRAIGGQVGMTSVHMEGLGFWSGRTGGLSLTGTDRPTPGALDALGKALTVRQEKDRAAARDAGQQLPDSTGDVTLDQVLPAGELPLPEFDIDQPAYSFVSASFTDTTTDGNAFGLFVAGANGIDIRGGAFDNSLVDGLVLHRFVSNAVVEGTRAQGNGGDGIVLARATTGAVLSEVVASENARNGVTVSGLPLADGPSATGTAVGDYGNNSVANSTIERNGRYGIEVVGGHNIGVHANDLVGNDMAVVVREGARSVSVVGNDVVDAGRQGIALRDGVTASTVSGNIVTGSQTALYVRDSQVDVVRNTVTGATSHGVSLVGAVAGTTVEQNTFAGRGPSAVDTQRAEGAELRRSDNETAGWSDTTPWLVTLKRFLQPLTLMWLGLGLLVVVTAARGLRSRHELTHPYADKAPVSSEQDVLLPSAAGRG